MSIFDYFFYFLIQFLLPVLTFVLYAVYYFCKKEIFSKVNPIQKESSQVGLSLNQSESVSNNISESERDQAQLVPQNLTQPNLT